MRILYLVNGRVVGRGRRGYPDVGRRAGTVYCFLAASNRSRDLHERKHSTD